ncbi:MAG: choice-of-anchor Q domain-containing protein [Myxococcota bacterium]
MNTASIAASFAVLAGLLTSTSALAATYQVTTTADDLDPALCDDTAASRCSLRTAIDLANQTAEHDDIIVPPGLYVLDNDGEGTIEIHTPMAIIGQAAGRTVIEPSMPLQAGFFISGEETEVRFESLSFEGGSEPQHGLLQAFGAGSLYLLDVDVLDFDFDETLVAAQGTNLQLHGVTFAGNTTDESAEPMVWTTGHLLAERLVLADNVMEGEGSSVVDASGGMARLRHIEIRDNSSDSFIVQLRSHFHVEGLYFHDNASEDGGLAVGHSNGGVIEQSTFASNTAKEGAALLVVEPEVNYVTTEVENSTFFGNEGVRGSAIAAAGMVQGRHLTIADNDSEFGVIYGIAGVATKIELEASVVAGKSAAPVCGGVPLGSNGYNLFEDASCPASALDIVEQPAGLDDQLTYGNFTPTVQPRGKSPLLDAVPTSALQADQRGRSRVAGAADIGAVECGAHGC